MYDVGAWLAAAPAALAAFAASFALRSASLRSYCSRADALIVGRRLEQFFHVVDTAPIRRQLEIVIHDDRVERTVLGAEAAVHADVHVDVELGRLGDRAARVRVVRTHDPDALRRADLGTDAAGGTALFLRAIWFFIVHQERNISASLPA